MIALFYGKGPMADNTEDLEQRIANLIPENPPETEAEQLALQQRLQALSDEFDEIAETVEAMTQAIMESYGVTEEQLRDLPEA